jgi:hypothetical protein
MRPPFCSHFTDGVHGHKRRDGPAHSAHVAAPMEGFATGQQPRRADEGDAEAMQVTDEARCTARRIQGCSR